MCTLARPRRHARRAAAPAGVAVALVALTLAHSAACASFGGMSFPTAFIPRQPDADTFPDVGAAVIEDVATLEFRVMTLPQARGSRLVAVLDHRRRLKVLREEGLAEADVSLPIDGYTTVTRVSARSVAPGGHAQSLDTSTLSALARARPAERAPDIKTLRFHIPGGQVGGLLEYRYERIYTDPNLVPPWVFGDRLPVLRSEFGLVVNPALKVDYRYGHGETLIDHTPLQRQLEGGRERLVFIEQDLPPYYHEPLMPELTHVAPWLAVALRTSRLGQQTVRVETWDDVAGLVLERLKQVTDVPGADGSIEERYVRLRQKLKPLQLNGMGVRPPQSAVSLLHGTPACSRDAASLMVQSFSGTATEAFVALLTGPTGPVMAPDFPALYPFTRAIAAVQATAEIAGDPSCSKPPLEQGPWCGLSAGDPIFLDPLCQTCPFGALPLELTGGRALLIGNGPARWVAVPQDTPQRNALIVRAALGMQVTGALEGTVDVEARGSLAQRLRDRLADTPDEAQGALIRDALVGGERGPHVGMYSVDRDPENEAPLTLHAHLNQASERLDYQRYRLTVEDLIGSSIPSAWVGTRRTAAVMDGPRWGETTVEVALPTGYEATLTAPIRLNSPLLDYQASFSLHGRTLKLSRRLVLKGHVVSPAAWDDLQDVVAKIRAFEADGPTAAAGRE